MPKQKFNSTLIGKVKRAHVKLVLNRMFKIAVNIHNKLSDETPKDLGVAARGWNFTLNRKDTTIPRKPPKGTVLSPQSSVPDIEAASLGDKYNLTNAVPYLKFLNEGHSQKAPARFIEQAVFDGTKEIK